LKKKDQALRPFKIKNRLPSRQIETGAGL
jgi:hypothetical protein